MKSFNEEAARQSPMWVPAETPQRPMMGLGAELEIDKNGLAQLYDTVDGTYWRGWLSTAEEILRHPQQFGPNGPRFITLPEKRRRDADAAERQREDRIRLEVSNEFSLAETRKIREQELRASIRAELEAEMRAKAQPTAQQSASASASPTLKSSPAPAPVAKALPSGKASPKA
jgi:hypothetical protein